MSYIRDMMNASAGLICEILQDTDDEWPVVDGEDLDLENCILTEIIIVAGGDWQPAHRLTISVDGAPHIVKTEILDNE